jgi:hypothetical protein
VEWTSVGQFSGFGKIRFAKRLAGKVGLLQTLVDTLTPYFQGFIFDLGLRVKGRIGLGLLKK